MYRTKVIYFPGKRNEESFSSSSISRLRWVISWPRFCEFITPSKIWTQTHMNINYTWVRMGFWRVSDSRSMIDKRAIHSPYSLIPTCILYYVHVYQWTGGLKVNLHRSIVWWRCTNLAAFSLLIPNTCMRRRIFSINYSPWLISSIDPIRYLSVSSPERELFFNRLLIKSLARFVHSPHSASIDRRPALDPHEHVREVVGSTCDIPDMCNDSKYQTTIIWTAYF